MNNVTQIRSSKSLLMVERMILESLIKDDKNLSQLAQDTGLKSELLSNVLANLINDNMVTFNGHRYGLNQKQAATFMKNYQSSRDQLEELKELFVTMINSSFEGKGKIKLQKVFLTKQEEAILGSYFINLEAFIKSIKEGRKMNSVAESTGEQHVFIWGEAKYKDLALESLFAV